MEDLDQKAQTTSWWIASLAGSVFLCALFAGYMFDIKEDLNNAKVRASLLEQRINIMDSEVDSLRRHILMQQAQVISSDKVVPPVSNTLVPLMPEMPAMDVGSPPTPSTVPSAPAAEHAAPVSTMPELVPLAPIKP